MPNLAPQALVDDVVLQEVAAELAREIYPVDDILQRYGVHPTIFEKVKRTHHFMSMCAEARITWQSSTNARERTQLKSQVMVEKMLEPGWRAFNDQSQPLAARVQMLQTVAKLAGMLDGPRDPAAAAIAPGDKVQITINLSAPPPQYRDVGSAKPIIEISGKAVDLGPSDPLEPDPVTPESKT